MNGDELNKRINRLIGQLRGIQKMADEGRECADILQQISAVKKSIDSLSKEMVMENINKFIDKSNTDKVSKMIERAINL